MMQAEVSCRNVYKNFLILLGLCFHIAYGLNEIWIGTSPFCGGEPKDCTVRGMDYIRSDKSGDGARCWTGEKVLCREPANPRPQMWIGTSPSCGGKAKDCSFFDMEYIQSDKSGDGKSCLTGTKVLCKSRPLASPNSKNTDPNQLTIVSYNIYGRPYFISHDGQAERSCHIPRALINAQPETDVVVLNEAFLDSYTPVKLSFRSLWKYYGFPYSTSTVGDSTVAPLTFINGGVFITSRWPIEEQKSMIFKHYTTWEADRLARKGVVYAKINKNGQRYHVFGTHLQAQESAENDRIRVLQAGEFKAFVESQNLKADDRVIYAGDLNAEDIHNSPHVKNVVNALDAVLLPKAPDSHAYTEDGSINNVSEKNTNKFWLDYIMYPKKYQHPNNNPTMKSLVLLADTPFEMCFSAPLQPHYVFPDSGWCKTTKTSRNLSDHFPVMSIFKY